MATRVSEGPAPWLTTRILAWTSFDVVSSVYIGIVPNVFFPVYFQRFVVPDDGATTAWGLLTAASIVVSGSAALAAAALARHVARLRLMVVFTALLAATLLFLSLDLPLSIWTVSIGYVIAQSCYFAATTNYESFLPDIAPAGTRGRISGFGWALGYGGGAAGTIVLLAVLSNQPQDARLYQMTFAIVAISMAALGLFAFIAMNRTGFMSLGPTLVRPQWMSIVGALRNWRQHRPIFGLLAGTMLIHSAIAVVVSFTAPMLDSRFGQTYGDLLWLVLFLQLLSMPTTYLSAMLSDSWSKSQAMMLVLSGWSIVLLLLALGDGPWMPWVIVSVLGLCLGATNAAMRGFLAEAVRPGQAAAFFGISTFIGRISSALGPLLFVAVSKFAGQRMGLMTILAVLVAGGAILWSHLRREPESNVKAKS